MSAFAEGFVRGALSGSIALLVGLVVAETTRFMGFAPWITAGLGVWAFLCVAAIMKPSTRWPS